MRRRSIITLIVLAMSLAAALQRGTQMFPALQSSIEYHVRATWWNALLSVHAQKTEVQVQGFANRRPPITSTLITGEQQLNPVEKKRKPLPVGHRARPIPIPFEEDEDPPEEPLKILPAFFAAQEEAESAPPSFYQEVVEPVALEIAQNVQPPEPATVQLDVDELAENPLPPVKALKPVDVKRAVNFEVTFGPHDKVKFVVTRLARCIEEGKSKKPAVRFHITQHLKKEFNMLLRFDVRSHIVKIEPTE